MPRRTPDELRALGYVQAPAGTVPAEGQALFRSKRADYVIDENGCWIWQKSKLDGYGMCGGGRAHRVYWERANGPIPEGYDVHHECKVPACVNPAHLDAIDARRHDIDHFLTERANGLTLEDIAEIKRLGTIPGVSARDVCKRYGISNWTVYLYWTGQRWTPETGEGRNDPEPWVCAASDCDKPVVGHRHKRYCSQRCRARVGGRRRRAGITSPGGSNGLFFDATAMTKEEERA